MTDLLTPARLIQRLAHERVTLIDKIQQGAGYSGPAPSPADTAEMKARLRAMKDVLAWIEDIEASAAIDRVRQKMKGA